MLAARWAGHAPRAFLIFGSCGAYQACLPGLLGELNGGLYLVQGLLAAFQRVAVLLVKVSNRRTWPHGCCMRLWVWSQPPSSRPAALTRRPAAGWQRAAAGHVTSVLPIFTGTSPALINQAG